MATRTGENDWIREKKSWLITTNSKSRGNFEPIDPATGSWTLAELHRHLGAGELAVLPLLGKWAGEVLVSGADPGRPDHFHNELAGNLASAAAGGSHRLFGPVLSTRMELLADEVLGLRMPSPGELETGPVQV